MKRILFWIGLFLFIFLLSLLFTSCCPKFPEAVSSTHTVDTVYKDTIIEVFVPVPADTFEINFDQFCDSLKKGLRPVVKLQVKHSDHTGSVILDTQKSIIICDEDTLRHQLALKDILIFDQRNTITENTDKIHKLERKISLWQGVSLALGIVALFMIGIFYIIRKK